MGSLNARRSVPADEPGEKGPFLGLPFFGAKRLVTLRVNFGRFYILVLGILGSCKIHTSHVTEQRLRSLDPS